MLAYGFTENLKFGAKTDRNSVFHSRGPHIADWLSLAVSYKNFYGFWKISHFRSKSIGVSLLIYQKLPACGKDWPKLHISWSWPTYCDSVIHNGPVYEILWILKSSHFRSISIGVSLRFYRKLPVWGKNWPKLRISWSLHPILWIGYPSWSRIWIFTGFEEFHIFARNLLVLPYGFTENRKFGAKMDRNSVFLGREPRIADWLSITASYMYFYGFWQISHFRSKCIGVGLRFYRKSPVSVKNWPKCRISWSWTPHCRSVIHNSLVYEFLWFLKIFTFSLQMHRCWPTVLPKIASFDQKPAETLYFFVVTPVLWIGYP